MRYHPRITGLLPLIGLAAASAHAETSASDPLTAKFDEAWSLVKLYENKNNPYLQKLAFTGRLQLDYSIVEGDGSTAAGIDGNISDDFGGWRRLRGGFKAQVFRDFTLHAEADFDPDEAPVYQRLTDAYLAWTPGDDLELKLGKQSMGFTLDGGTSSKELLTIDRNNLTNNLWFTEEYIPGFTVAYTPSNWEFTAGVFSQGGNDGEFGDFDAESSWLASVGYDFTGCTGAEVSTLRLDYVYNEKTLVPDLFTNRNLGQVVSLVGLYEKQDFGFRGDISFGDGFLGQPDIFGLVLMPYYNITDKLQAVCRYTYLDSDGDDGLRFARYESESIGNRGDRYHEIYGGLNYFLYGHKLKLQTGLQWVTMHDGANNGGEFDGWSWTTGFRLSW
jgi:phosphate-selective porin OprO and OprP